MDGCDGNDGGLDGLDMGHGSVAGLCGFDTASWDGIDAEDVLGGTPRDLSLGFDAPVQPKNGVAVFDDGNLFAVRVLRHGDANLMNIVKASADREGLLKVAPILVGQRELCETACSILPTNAWSGAKKGGMPTGYVAGMTGKTVMFRLFYQIPTRVWGPFSSPTRDKEAGVYLDIATMTWTMKDGTGDSQTQLLIRVVPLTILDSRSKLWCQRTTKVEAHRKVGRTLSQAMFQSVLHYAPSAVKAAKAEVVSRPAPRPAPRAELAAARPRFTGVDLWSALVGSPQLAAAHTFASGIPSTTNTMPHTGPVLESEMVAVRVALPRRTAAVS